MSDWNIIVIIISIVLLAFLLWKEWTRKNKSLLFARLSATVVAVVSLYLLAMPPEYSSKSIRDKSSLILLTEGFAEDSVVALPGNQQMPVYQLTDVNPKSIKAKKGFLIDEILANHPGVNAVHVFGYGLENYQLKQLAGNELVLHQTPAPDGFYKMHYNDEVQIGENLELHGGFRNSDTGAMRVELIGFGKVLDSARCDQHGNFNLKAMPYHVGRAEYSLIAIKDKDTIEKQPVPVLVNEIDSLQVVLLGSTPGFESRFLKDWLAKKGARLILKTKLGAKSFSRQYINEERDMNGIDEFLLAETDCIIADYGAISLLQSFELNAIKKAVADKGMGLLINIDGEQSVSQNRFPFRARKLTGGEHQKLELQLNSGLRLKTLNTESQVELVDVAAYFPILRSTSGKIFSAVGIEGKGKIIFNTVNYTYKWMLSGAGHDYNQFWTTLLEEVIRKKIEEKWRVLPEKPLVNHPLQVLVETESPSPVAKISDQAIYLENNEMFPSQWEGKFWSRHPGWQAIRKTDGNLGWFYVYPDQAWWPLRMNQRLVETAHYVSGTKRKSVVPEQQEKEEKKQIPALFFLIFFMVAAGFLWWENKRMSG